MQRGAPERVVEADLADVGVLLRGEQRVGFRVLPLGGQRRGLRQQVVQGGLRERLPARARHREHEANDQQGKDSGAAAHSDPYLRAAASQVAASPGAIGRAGEFL